MGFFDSIFKRNSELNVMYDFELIEDTSSRIHLKKLVLQTCINVIGRAISQSEFRVKDRKKALKNELYYRLNVRPSKNMSASTFWQNVIYKLIYENECLIIKSDSDDLLIADTFVRNEYAIYEDIFKKVTVKDYEFKRSFKMSEVLYLEYSNHKLSALVNGLYEDYGELFGRIVEMQKRKNQIRGVVDIEGAFKKEEDAQSKIQSYIDKIFKAFTEKTVAIVPQQKGFEYKEMTNADNKQMSVDEVDKVLDGFTSKVANAIGIPVALLKGEMSDIEKQTKNFMTFCIGPLLKMIGDELNAKFFDKQEFLKGQKVDIKRVSYSSLFDLATSIDKLISSSAFTGNEIREEVGYEPSDEPLMDKHIITKNYIELDKLDEGGEN